MSSVTVEWGLHKTRRRLHGKTVIFGMDRMAEPPYLGERYGKIHAAGFRSAAPRARSRGGRTSLRPHRRGSAHEGQLPGTGNLACGYRHAETVQDGDGLVAALSRHLSVEGPTLVRMAIRTGARKDLGRPKLSPRSVWERFCDFVQRAPGE